MRGVFLPSGDGGEREGGREVGEGEWGEGRYKEAKGVEGGRMDSLFIKSPRLGKKNLKTSLGHARAPCPDDRHTSSRAGDKCQGSICSPAPYERDREIIVAIKQFNART